ncbi:CorA family divalent cation transporter [Cellulomonas sp. SLBN-39]|uniref:CorA family divalent cation transporter n=1 Tax=Cellulomonas sp. SLBN-39 TaxID=2768446 RepID=UPI001154D750|nr:CorA family divalent cation transporter [Cellulomonas sp. SLBN-39]TQL04005.1 magnesium transporter [Cellulomonas sp. SLBN-39]
MTASAPDDHDDGPVRPGVLPDEDAAPDDAPAGAPAGARGWVEGVAGTWVPLDDPAVRPGEAAARGATWLTVVDVADVADALAAVGTDVRTVETVRASTVQAEAPLPTTEHPRLRARAERLPGGGLLLTAPTLTWVDTSWDVRTGRVVVVVRDDVVVTAEDGDAGVVSATVDRLTHGRRASGEHGVRAVLAAVLLTLAGRGAELELAVGDAVGDVERLVLSERPAADALDRLYALKREIAEARRALAPLGTHLGELVEEVLDGDAAHRQPDWLRRVQVAVDRADRHLQAHDSLLGDMLAVHLAQVSVRQNEDMRKISAWAAIVAVPTLVAGVYGMNFRHMPELAWPLGYPVAVGGMAVLCVLLWGLFRRSGWL